VAFCISIGVIAGADRSANDGSGAGINKGGSLYSIMAALATRHHMPAQRAMLPTLQAATDYGSILSALGSNFGFFSSCAFVCVPVFIVDGIDAMKSVPVELRQMVNSFRPTLAQYYTKIIIPAIVPNLLTSWKINLTLAVRVVTIAEFVGASQWRGK
jgi:NitT/TauT family transport system permease protein